MFDVRAIVYFAMDVFFICFCCALFISKSVVCFYVLDIFIMVYIVEWGMKKE